MNSKLQYWKERYEQQGLKTVGHSGLTEEQFQEKTARVIRLLIGFIDRNNVVAERFLDFGCGVGRMSQTLSAFFSEVHGVDIVDWAVEQARVNCTSVWVFDGIRFPFEDSYFDGCLSWTVLQHIPPGEVEKVCGEISRVIAVDGSLILYENVSVQYEDKPHIWFRKVEDYAKMLPGFSVVDCEIVKDADGYDEDHALMLLIKQGDSRIIPEFQDSTGDGG